MKDWWKKIPKELDDLLCGINDLLFGHLVLKAPDDHKIKKSSVDIINTAQNDEIMIWKIEITGLWANNKESLKKFLKSSEHFEKEKYIFYPTEGPENADKNSDSPD